MDPELVRGLVTVAVGAVSGGITNAVAIWMLFHPYEARGIGRLTIQGAIPKNKARLARSIGRTVGERLLTPEDLAGRLSAPAVRQAFDAAVGGILDGILERERGPLRDQLPPDLVVAVDEAMAGIAPRIAGRVAAWAESEEFERLATGWMERIREEVADRPLGESLTEGRRAALKDKVESWVGRLAEDDELERTLRGFVERHLDQLSRDDAPLLDRLPPGIIGALEHAITDYLPIALERLSALLTDPDARAMVEDALRTAFDNSVRDLLIHERILARLVVTDRTIERLVDGFEQEGLDRFAESLARPEMKAQVTRAVNDAVVNFLRQPLGERLRRFTPERREALIGTLGDWLVRVARDRTTRDAIARTVDRALDAVERRTWGDVLGVIPAERLAGALAEVLAGEQGKRWIEESVAQVAGRLLARPIGRPADWLGAETSAAIRTGISGAVWVWLQQQIPRVVEQIRVPEMVEQKVLGFSTQRMEEIVRNVTQRELDLIVRLGYVFGGLVGVVAWGVNALLG
ncbi:MAG: DUF445 family protein [Gemmatimonadales bacterium]|nr:DUF445 family protein [Gemmatimonadales bacterium]